ncbi:hypothetical protein Efla_001077 [Eimeria flavescens]
MQARHVALRPAARRVFFTQPAVHAPQPRLLCSPTALSASSVGGGRQLPRCRFLSTADAPSQARGDLPVESRGLQAWERPLLAEVYRQLRGQHIEEPSAASSAPLNASSPASIPGWDFTPEDERGLRFGSAYMLLTLAWNRKFTRLRELLFNANRAKEGCKQVLSRVITVIATDLPGARNAASDSDGTDSSRENSTEEAEGEEEASLSDKTESGGSSRGPQQLLPESFLGRLQGCLGQQLQQLLQQQAAFLAQRGLNIHAVIRPQRVAVDAVYGIVGCTRGSSATSMVLLQHGSVQVLLRRGSNSSSLGAPATMYVAKPRPFDFEGAVAAAEAASGQPAGSKPVVAAAGEDEGDAEAGESMAGGETGLSALDKRLQHMNAESIWRKRAREQMQDILRRPLTFRQFMNMCADCGSALDRGFVVVIDFKLLCSQQLAILDGKNKVVMGSKQDEAAVHTLRLELNAKFDANNSNFMFPAFEPSSWQLVDWNYAIGPLYPVDPREISNVAFCESVE